MREYLDAWDRTGSGARPLLHPPGPGRPAPARRRRPQLQRREVLTSRSVPPRRAVPIAAPPARPARYRRSHATRSPSIQPPGPIGSSPPRRWPVAAVGLAACGHGGARPAPPPPGARRRAAGGHGVHDPGRRRALHVLRHHRPRPGRRRLADPPPHRRPGRRPRLLRAGDLRVQAPRRRRRRPVGWKAAYEPGPVTEDGSGKAVPVKGTAYLVVHFSAQGVDLTKADAPDTYPGPTSLEAAGATRIQQVRRTGDFEGVLTWVIGVDQPAAVPRHHPGQPGPGHRRRRRLTASAAQPGRPPPGSASPSPRRYDQRWSTTVNPSAR